MTKTVIEYVLGRLKKLGITDVFGMPGDYAFPVNDAICQDPNLRWIGNCNELNAAYAADGYARIKGFAALNTTYGVGELSAINGIAGAYAEHLPIFHLVGMPGTHVLDSQALVHHTFEEGEFYLFEKLSQPIVCASSIITPQNCLSETERLISAALYHRRPVYMGFPANYVNIPISGEAQPIAPPTSNPENLEAALRDIVETLMKAKTVCILPGIFTERYGLKQELLDFVNATGFPFATMFMDKSVLDETHPSFIGMYAGQLMNPEICEFVENCDVVLGIGAIFSDVNSGAFTSKLSPSKTINIMHHHVRVRNAQYENIEMKDTLQALTKRLPKRTDIKGPKKHGLNQPEGNPKSKITENYLYPRLQQFFKPNDIIIAETGTSSFGLGDAQLPKGVSFQNQTLWGSIGWATPAALGAALAAADRRVILITGEGSHQLTAQEICQFYRYNLKPIIFIINNNGYLIERLLCKNPEIVYNDIAIWNYSQLPAALGCEDWFTAKAFTCGELDEAIKKAETCGTGVYIEVVTEKYVAPPLTKKLTEFIAAKH